jgi:hypothetical protein
MPTVMSSANYFIPLTSGSTITIQAFGEDASPTGGALAFKAPGEGLVDVAPETGVVWKWTFVLGPGPVVSIPTGGGSVTKDSSLPGPPAIFHFALAASATHPTSGAKEPVDLRVWRDGDLLTARSTKPEGPVSDTVVRLAGADIDIYFRG